MKRLICLIFGHKWKGRAGELLHKGKAHDIYVQELCCLRCGEWDGRLALYQRIDIEKEIIKIKGATKPFGDYFKPFNSND